MTSLIVIVLCIGLLIGLGVIEKQRNEENIKKIDLRININGTRGKTTVTRLVTGVLQAAGYQVIGKTTGTESRIIYWDQAEEEEIERPPSGPNISEQISVIEKARKRGADALVLECMAVNPEYQDVYSNEMFQSNITAIVNVFEDHMDILGPTNDQIAWAYAKTIPKNGLVVISDDDYKDFFIEVAQERNCRVKVIDEPGVSQELLDRFDYLVFPNNLAVPLAIAEELDVDRDTAIKGMLQADPDPGIMQLFEIGEPIDQKVILAYAFAANEPTSTMLIYEELKEGGLIGESPIILINCREDRSDRTKLFTKDFIGQIKDARVIAIGQNTGIIEKAIKSGRIKVRDYLSLEGKSLEDIYMTLMTYASGEVVLGIGNIHGVGEDFFAYLDENNLWQRRRMN